MKGPVKLFSMVLTFTIAAALVSSLSSVEGAEERVRSEDGCQHNEHCTLECGKAVGLCVKGSCVCLGDNNGVDLLQQCVTEKDCTILCTEQPFCTRECVHGRCTCVCSK